MKTLSLLIPVYNEERRLDKTFNALKAGFDTNGLKFEKIIFVNDGSLDKTSEVITNNKKDLEKATNAVVELVAYKPNQGKGNAIRVGMQKSTSDYTLFFDADMATPLTEFSKFAPYIKAGADIIIGTRKNGQSTVQVHQPFIRENMGKVFTLLSKTMLNTWVTDFTCGFKVFSKEAKDQIFTRSLIKRWGYDSEILFLARKLGYQINEKAVLWYDDSDTKVDLKKAVVTSMMELIKIRYYDISGKYHLSRIPNFVRQFKFT